MKLKYLVLGVIGMAGLLYLSQYLIPHRMDVQEPGPHSVQTTAGETGTPLVDVIVPEFSVAAQIGREIFEVSCAACHGTNAAGQDGVAPPLVHSIYEPNHHSDQSFYQAVRYGVRAHHWRFGDMPAIEGVSQNQVSDIIAYVRELQRANGIF